MDKGQEYLSQALDDYNAQNYPSALSVASGYACFNKASRLKNYL